MDALRVTASTVLPTAFGTFQISSFRTQVDVEPHIALTMGLPSQPGQIPLIRVHSECLTGEVFKSASCDCGGQLQSAMKQIKQHGCGAIIYLRQEGRGIGIENKLKAYALQQQGLDTIDANLALGLPVDARDYSPAVWMLRHLKVNQCNLLTNNPDKVLAICQAGIKVLVQVPLLVRQDHPIFRRYQQTKKNRMGHLL